MEKHIISEGTGIQYGRIGDYHLLCLKVPDSPPIRQYGSGNDVMVFTYKDTTYAPLRALAEAYGLEVGYDSSRNLAAVNSPKEQDAVSSSDLQPLRDRVPKGHLS